MSNAPTKRSQPGSPAQSPASFNWPPIADELAQYTFGVEAVQNESDQPHADGHWPPPDEALRSHGGGVVQSSAVFDELGLVTAEPYVSPPSLSPSLEPRYELSDGPPRDEGLTPSDDSMHSGVWSSSTSVIARAQSDPVLDGTGAGEWATEMARLQALIDALTAPLEWGVTNVTAHERRPKL